MISVKEAQDILNKREESCGARSVEESNTTQSPTPSSPVNIEHRKILTPKGRFFYVSQSLLQTKLHVSASTLGFFLSVNSVTLSGFKKNLQNATFPPRVSAYKRFLCAFAGFMADICDASGFWNRPLRVSANANSQKTTTNISEIPSLVHVVFAGFPLVSPVQGYWCTAHEREKST